MTSPALLPDEFLPDFPRRFLPRALEVDEWSAAERFFKALEDRALSSAAELEGWIEDWSELSSAIEEQRTRRYVAMTLATDDAEAAEAYRRFERDFIPQAKRARRRLARRYLDSPLRRGLEPARWAVFERQVALEVKLFREENLALEVADRELAQRYQTIAGGWTVIFRGHERTAQQVAVFLEDPDQATRAEAFEALSERRQRDADELEELFDRMIALRHEIAGNAGVEDFRAYSFERLRRFDYGPLECERLQESIAAAVVPRLREQHERRRAALGLETLAPYDLGHDPWGGDPLRPFGNADELYTGCHRIFARLDPVLGAWFESIHTRGLLELESRKGKAPGGYQANFQERRLPFIFTNAAGVQRDVETLLHEGGHAFHTLACRHERLIEYREAPIEFCEVASMGMELLAAPHLDAFYTEPRAALRARLKHLQGILELLPWIACIDAFQHWIYTHPTHTADLRRARWLELHERFGGGVDWSGLEAYRAVLWHKQNHLFTAPFYYIEYAIAQLGALQLWRCARADQGAALRRYREALALGGARPLPELFAAAGLEFDMSAGTLGPLVEDLCREIEAIEGRLSGARQLFTSSSGARQRFTRSADAPGETLPGT